MKSDCTSSREAGDQSFRSALKDPGRYVENVLWSIRRQENVQIITRRSCRSPDNKEEELQMSRCRRSGGGLWETAFPGGFEIVREPREKVSGGCRRSWKRDVQKEELEMKEEEMEEVEIEKEEVEEVELEEEDNKVGGFFQRVTEDFGPSRSVKRLFSVEEVEERLLGRR